MKSFWQRFLGNPRVIIGLVWLGARRADRACCADVLAPRDPFAIVGTAVRAARTAISCSEPTASAATCSPACVHGARTTLLIAVVSTLAAVAFGTLVGAVAGYYGGLIDDVLMRIDRVLPDDPVVPLRHRARSRSCRRPRSTSSSPSRPSAGRRSRASCAARSCRSNRASSCRPRSLPASATAPSCSRQVLPNTLSPLIVTGSLLVATAILIESALSFLGLGAPNLMSWGFMIGAGRSVPARCLVARHHARGSRSC